MSDYKSELINNIDILKGKTFTTTVTHNNNHIQSIVREDFENEIKIHSDGFIKYMIAKEGTNFPIHIAMSDYLDEYLKNKSKSGGIVQRLENNKDSMVLSLSNSKVTAVKEIFKIFKEELMNHIIINSIKNKNLNVWVIDNKLSFLNNLPIIVDYSVLPYLPNPLLIFNKTTKKYWLVKNYSNKERKGVELKEIVFRNGCLEIVVSMILFDSIQKDGIFQIIKDEPNEIKERIDDCPYYSFQEITGITNMIINLLIAYKYYQTEIVNEELNPVVAKIQERIKNRVDVNRNRILLNKESSVRFVDINLFLDRKKMRAAYRQTKPNGEPLFEMKPHYRKPHEHSYWKKDPETGEKYQVKHDLPAIGVKGYDVSQGIQVVEVLR